MQANKLIGMLITGLSLSILSSYANAEFSANDTSIKRTKVPFIHMLVPSKGLVIDYDMSGKHPQKVSCVFENFYKPYLYYMEQGKQVLGSFGGQVYFTSKGQNFEETQGLDTLDQYHVDAKSSIIVVDVPNDNESYATCFYVPEDAK